MKQSDGKCDVSFAIASYNSLPFLGEAIRSALAQTSVSVEVLVVDDHSSDGSKAAAEEWSRRDSRVRVLQTQRNGGPGAARNVAIDHMRGDWYAILDSDDLVTPERSRLLIDAAEADNADMIADDLVVFGDAIVETRHLATEATGSSAPQSLKLIDTETYFRSTVMFGKRPNLGFLKPMIRASALRSTGVRYQADLRIGEDDEFVVRLLLAGLRYALLPQAHYLYRKHGASVSHRLSLANAEAMLLSEQAVAHDIREAGLTSDAYDTRYRSIERATAFTRSVTALKKRRVAAAITPLLATPRAALLYSMPIGAMIRRMTGRS